MSYDDYFQRCADQFVLMGGLDVQTTIGFGRHEALQADIRRVMARFAEGGLLFCTTHFVQDHCTVDELTFAYDLIHELVRRPGRQ